MVIWFPAGQASENCPSMLVMVPRMVPSSLICAPMMGSPSASVTVPCSSGVSRSAFFSVMLSCPWMGIGWRAVAASVKTAMRRDVFLILIGVLLLCVSVWIYVYICVFYFRCRRVIRLQSYAFWMVLQCLSRFFFVTLPLERRCRRVWQSCRQRAASLIMNHEYDYYGAHKWLPSEGVSSSRQALGADDGFA